MNSQSTAVIASVIMCGIFGHYVFGKVTTRKEILDILFNGLRRLEYRGYDSAGLSIESQPFLLTSEADIVGPSPIIVKSKGNIPALEAALEEAALDVDVEFRHHVGTTSSPPDPTNATKCVFFILLPCTETRTYCRVCQVSLQSVMPHGSFCLAAISHTRWATHGEPSAQNSHPITSGPKAAFTVVHNGIITNFAKLRAFLEEEGERFYTDTDTEVIAKMCSHLHSNLEEAVPFSELVMMVLRKLEGAYAILVQSTHYPGELVCARKGSPVVLGLKDSAKASTRRFGRMRESVSNCFESDTLECIIASDDKAIIEHTRVRCGARENTSGTR